MKKKTFTVWYKASGVYEAKIPAQDLKEALENASAMTIADLHKTPGDVVEEDAPIITAVFE